MLLDARVAAAPNQLNQEIVMHERISKSPAYEEKQRVADNLLVIGDDRAHEHGHTVETDTAQCGTRGREARKFP